MPSPLVSAIIPARNAERTIGNALASVLEQTMPDFELIVIDDASTDRTAATVTATRDARIRLLRSERNIGQAAARNWGVRNAQGKWAAFLDADDEWAPRRLERLLGASRGQECYVSDLEVLAVPGPSGRLLRATAPRQIENGYVAELHLETALRLTQDIRPMLPVSWFGEGGIEFPEWGSGGDWVFLLARLSAQGKQGRMVWSPGYLYRAQAAHHSSTIQAREEAIRVFQALAADDAFPESIRELLKRQLKGLQDALVAGALRHRMTSEFLHYAARYPSALPALPRRALLFCVARARVLLAQAALNRLEGTQRAPFVAEAGPRRPRPAEPEAGSASEEGYV